MNMKKTIHLFVLNTLAALLISTCLFAQSPNAIPYQAVARDASGNLLSNQPISLRFTIIDSNINSIDYQETQSVTTNSLGLFTLHIGEGTPLSGAINNIAWNISGNEYLKVEMDPTGGTSYVDMGTTRFLSVPFALHANTSGDHDWIKTGSDLSNSNSGKVGIGTNVINGKLHVASDNSNDELVVGENVFNTNDIANRIQIGHSTSNSFLRAGQDAASFVSLGWRFNADPNLGFGQLTTGSIYHPLAIQSFGGNVGISGNITPQHKVSIGEPTTDVQSISLRTYNDNLSSAWKGGAAFGYTQGSVIMGELYGIPTIGGHTGNLGAWNNLSINPGGGYVGVGTSTPSSTLDVNGVGKFGSFLKIGTDVAEGYFQNSQDGAYRALQTGGDQGYFFQNYNGYNTTMYVGLNGLYTGNVGIGTVAPTNRLEVIGNTKTSNFQMSSGAADGYLLKSDASGNASWQNPSTLGIWSTSGNAGTTPTTNFIGTTDATDFVVRTSNSEAVRIMNNTPTPPGILAPSDFLRITRQGTSGTKWPLSASMQLGSYANGANAQTQLDIAVGNGPTPTPDTKVMTLLGNGNVGIGNTIPSTKLDVAGQVKISGGSPGAGKVLTSDANGLATWQKSGAIAYGFVTGGNTLINSYGVASFVRNSAGNYTITLSNSPGASVTFIGTFWDTNAYGFISYYNIGASNIEVRTRNASGISTDFSFSFAVFSPN